MVVRVKDAATGKFVYRPVDESSGHVQTKEEFEKQKAEERRRRLEADPKRQAEMEKKWVRAEG